MHHAKGTLFGFILSVALVACFSGCATTEPRPTESAKRDTEYQGTLDRVLVVFESNDLSAAYLGKEFQPQFAAQLGNRLKPRGVTLESMVISSDELDPNTALRATVTRFRATHVFHIALTGLQSVTKPTSANFENLPPSRWVENLKFSFQLHDSTAGKIVWRGDLRYPDPPTPESLAARFVESLGTEHFLRAAN